MKKEGYDIPSYHSTAHLQNLISLEHQLRSAEILSGLNMGIVEMQVHMDCSGCENKIRKALWKVEGVDDVDIDMAMQKVTVTGWTDRDRVLRTVRKTGRRAEFWPFPFDSPEYRVLGGQHYYYLDEFGPSLGLGQDRINRHPISTYNYYKHGYGGSDYGYYSRQLPAYGSSSSIVGEEAGSVFSDDNPHACTIIVNYVVFSLILSEGKLPIKPSDFFLSNKCVWRQGRQEKKETKKEIASTTTTALVHARCGCSPRLASPNFRGFLSSPSPSPSSSSSASSSSSSSPPSSSSSSSSGVNSLQAIKAQSMSTSSRGSPESPRGTRSVKNEADHLLVLVHGILASTSDWIYVEAELKRRLGRSFLIYASSCNTFTKTFDGIDAAGRRLADEVAEVVQKTDGLKKISFLAHSLGGLFARYAVAVLYTPKSSTAVQPDNTATSTSRPGLIAELEPVNFITLATPHLGVRGRKQLPLLLGVSLLEKIAAPMAPYLVGRTGSQLFLTDGSPNKPPLLLRMASDCEERKFISALGAFKCRILYANVSYDHLVGWRTSSIRREMELVKPPQRSLDGYKHVVDVEYRPPILSDGAHFSPEAAKAKAAAQNAPTIQNTVEYHEIVEEEMIQGLQQLGWKKVDVSFHSAMWPFFAHNNIHVKNEWLHNAGAGVVAHVADSLKQQESSSLYIAASL